MLCHNTRMLISKNALVISLLVIIALVFRLWMISDQKVYFWYDQARDADVSRSIFTDLDFKIQGPSASGTNDTVYHGVAYYYLIGPLYVLAQNNPYTVGVIFAVVHSFAVVLFFWLAKRITGSDITAFLAAFLLSVSFQHAQYSSWLSNPAMALLPILVFFTAVWILFYEDKTQDTIKWTVILAISMGLIQQSAIYSVYFLGAILVGFAYQAAQIKLKKKHSVNQLQQVVIFSLIYLLCISSMLLTQFQLYRAGIFNSEALTHTMSRGHNFIDTQELKELVLMYFDRVLSTVGPYHSIFGAVVSIAATVIFWKNATTKEKLFFSSWFLAPLWLFIVQFRSSSHILVGIEYPILFILAYALTKFFQKNNYFILGIIVVVVSLYSLYQVTTVRDFRAANASIFTTQKGVFLERQLEVIDLTYQEANFEPFSVSLWVSPYEYYVSWTYLYAWYGQEKYGYVPTYFGSSQTGKPGENLLAKSDKLGKTHFIIEEPDVVISGDYYQKFISFQDSVSSPSALLHPPGGTVTKIGGYTIHKRVSTQE